MAETFVGRLMHRAKSMHDKLETIKEKSEETMGRAMMLAEVSGANAAFSYVNGRYGKDGSGVDQHLAVVGVPADLGAGALLGGMGLVNLAGKYSEHAFNLGVGCLQSYLSRQLLGMGLTASAQASQTTSGYAGALPMPGQSWHGTPYAPHAYARG